MVDQSELGWLQGVRDKLREPEMSPKEKVLRAISTFYLDVEISEQGFLQLAEVFKHSGYIIGELRKMDYLEVHPILNANLKIVAGIWSGFDDSWMDQIKDRPTRWRRIGFKIRKRLNCLPNQHYWSEIEKLIS